jgi:hypothetical protein
MSVCMCRLPFAKQITGKDANAIRRAWKALPTSCMDSRCSPGGCQANCKAYAAGAVRAAENQPKQTKPPKAKGKGR